MAEEQKLLEQIPLKRRKRKRQVPADETEPWLLTYGDMVTLMMTFFILLFSMSEIDPVKVQMFADALTEQVGKTKVERKRLNLKMIFDKVNGIVAEQSMQEDVLIFTDKRGVTIELKGDVAFETGSANLAPKTIALLEKLAPEINAALNNDPPFPIAIEGHTDNIPMSKGGEFESNWELSGARASKTIRYLIDEAGVIAPVGKLSAIGYADTWPAAPNDTPEGRAKNRRVQIIFLTIG